MKSKFSTHWRKSRQTRKQRKYQANAPVHIKHKMLLTAHLSKDLRKKYGKRSFSVRKGDNVKVMVGKFRGKSGKIVSVDTKNGKIAIENMQMKKKDGSKINVYFNASNLLIQELELGDKYRVEALNRKVPAKKEVQKKEVKEVKKIEKKEKTGKKNV